jgi:hypothetical protein
VVRDLTMFDADKEYLVTFFLDNNLTMQSQQLNVWASDPDLTVESAQKRLAFQRGLGEQGINRVKIKEIISL